MALWIRSQGSGELGEARNLGPALPGSVRSQGKPGASRAQKTMEGPLPNPLEGHVALILGRLQDTSVVYQYQLQGTTAHNLVVTECFPT